jgi:hypothetical protein
MQTLRLAIIVVLAIHSTAYAQIGTDRTAAADRAFTSRDMYSLPHDMRSQTSSRIVRNANECAPDTANPVWGENASLLGYSCTAASANGG